MRLLNIFLVAFLTPALCLGSESSSTSPVQFEVPRERIYQDLSTLKPELTVPSRIRALASSWAPRSLSLPTRSAARPPFVRDDMPMLRLDYLSSIESGKRGELTLGLSVGYLAMHRAGSFESMGSTQTSEQSLQVLTFPLRMEFSPSALRASFASVRLGAGALPAVFLAGPSALSSGGTETSLAADTFVGVDFGLRGIGLDSLSLVTEANRSFQVAGDPELSGWGVSAGVQWQ